MKTNVIMKRQLDVFNIEQRTKDGWFNASDLSKRYSELHNVRKDVSDYLRLNSTKQLVQELENELVTQNTGIPVFTKTRGKNGGTWMHPLLFVDFAMWLSPKFKVKVLKFVRDNMIEFRNRAGDSYKKLADAVYKIVDKDFMSIAMSRIAEGINYVVFDNHCKDIRNQYGDENKMEELFQLEEQVAFLIDNGYEKSVEGVMNFLRRKYKDKYE